MYRFLIIFRSISGEEKDEKTDKTKTAKIAERLAKKREKLLSMKRCSGYLKRPEILETVYSVEVCVFSFRRSILFVCTC